MLKKLARPILSPALLWAIPSLWGLAYLLPPLNHDAAAILSCALQMLDGGRLYGDISDVNPPLIFWLVCLPAALARMLDADPTMVYSATVLGLIFTSIFLAKPWFQQLFAADNLGLRLMPPAALFALIVLPVGSFGQREHLMAILALPYIVLSGCRAGGVPVGRWRALLCVGVATLGFAIKPHFLAVPLLIELYVLFAGGLRRGLRDPAPWVMLAGFCLYLAAAFWITPAYFTAVLPLLLRHYEGQGWAGWVQALQSPPALGIVLGLMGVILLYALLRPAGVGWRRIIALLILFTTGATLAGILQGKGWDYHFVAGKIGLILLLAACLAASSVMIPARNATAMAATILLSLFVLSGSLSPPWPVQRGFAESPAGRLRQIIDRAAHNRPVLWLTSSIYPQFPVLTMTGSPTASPVLSLWLLSSLYASEAEKNYHPPEAMPPDEAQLFHDISASFATRKPQLVIVARARDEGFARQDFDYLDYFQREPTFARAFADYTLLIEIEGWRIYTRKG